MLCASVASRKLVIPTCTVLSNRFIYFAASQDLNLCGCSKVSVDGVSDMLYDRQEALEAQQAAGNDNTGMVRHQGLAHLQSL